MILSDKGLLLGGRLAPLGCVVAFIDRPVGQLRREVEAVWSDRPLDVAGPMRFEEAVERLDPMEAPWTREVIADCGDWSCYLNNGYDGGDSSAIAPAIAREMSATCVTAVHMPRYGPGHAQTQLSLQGPTGEPPLMQIRSLTAHCQDGRWSWHESGEAQPFEHVERYTVRLKRQRLDRSLLVEYLDAIGIDVDNGSFFGEAWLLRQSVDWPTRQESAASFRSENGWA